MAPAGCLKLSSVVAFEKSSMQRELRLAAMLILFVTVENASVEFFIRKVKDEVDIIEHWTDISLGFIQNQRE